MAAPDLKLVYAKGLESPLDGDIDAFLARCPESFAQQSTAWRDVVAPLGPDAPTYLVARSAAGIQGVLPAYRFDGLMGSILTTCPQAGALGGVACGPEADRPAVYRLLLEAFVELAREQGCALASILTNPFWPDDALCREWVAPDYVLENACTALDLREAVTDAGEFPRASSNQRRNLRKASSGALVMDEAQTLENVEEWYPIHAARHAHIGAEPLPKALFTGALEHMVPAGRARFFFVRLADAPGTMVAGGFYVLNGRVIDSFMPAVDTGWRQLSPNFLLAAHSIRWAREHGHLLYNWQASPPEGGVYRFKKQWGSDDATYYYLTRITGDASGFLDSTPEAVREAYRWHYALPFSEIGRPPRPGATSTRSESWSAGLGEGP